MPRRKGVSLTRSDVILAAIRLVERHGVEALGINRVAAELGIKPPSLYNHVNGNADLRDAVAAEAWRRTVGVIREAAGAGDTALARLLNVARAYRSFIRANARLHEVMTSGRVRYDDDVMAPHVREAVELMARVFKDLGLRGDDIIHATRAIRAMLHGFATLELAGQFGLPQSLEASFEFMVRGWAESLAPAPHKDQTDA